MKQLYTCKAIEEFIQRMLTDEGYEAIQLDEGTLGMGEWVLLSHDERKYNFHIREVYLNEWNSAHILRRMSNVSKTLVKKIEKAENRI